MFLEAAKPRALIIQSEGDSLSGYADCLLQQGWKFDQVELHKEQALQTTAQEYDLLIAGFSMPAIETIKLLEQLRNANPWQVILVVTSGSEKTNALDIIRAGATDVIENTSTPELVNKALTKAIRKSALSDRYSDRFVTACKTSYELKSGEITVANFNLRVVDQLIKAGRLDHKLASQIKLCFQEALTNSLDHGNLELDSEWKEELDENGVDRYEKIRKERLAMSEYADKMLFVTVDFDGSNLIFTIKDQGKGFDVNKKRKEIEENEANHGRGLYLINKIMDQIEFSKGGTQITFSKNLGNK